MRHPVLKHMRVRDYLRSLVTHELAVGDAIPSERLLCERFGVSRMTVRQAVDALVVDGLLGGWCSMGVLRALVIDSGR